MECEDEDEDVYIYTYVAWGRGRSIAGLVSFGGGWFAPGGGDICNFTPFLLGLFNIMIFFKKCVNVCRD